MTENEFTIAFWQYPKGRQLRDAQGERLVYKIAAAVDKQAAVMQKKGRPDRASRLRWISQRLTYGGLMTKGPVKKASADLDVVRSSLVDGISEAGL